MVVQEISMLLLWRSDDLPWLVTRWEALSLLIPTVGMGKTHGRTWDVSSLLLWRQVTGQGPASRLKARRQPRPHAYSQGGKAEGPLPYLGCQIALSIAV